MNMLLRLSAYTQWLCNCDSNESQRNVLSDGWRRNMRFWYAISYVGRSEREREADSVEWREEESKCKQAQMNTMHIARQHSLDSISLSGSHTLARAHFRCCLRLFRLSPLRSFASNRYFLSSICSPARTARPWNVLFMVFWLRRNFD